jgi:hypothetical protein
MSIIGMAIVRVPLATSSLASQRSHAVIPPPMVIPNSEKVPEYRFRKRTAQTKTRQKLKNTTHNTQPHHSTHNNGHLAPRWGAPQSHSQPVNTRFDCTGSPRRHRATTPLQDKQCQKNALLTNHRGVCSLSSSTAPSCVSALQAPLNGHVADCGAACPHRPSYTCGHGAAFCCRTPSPRLDAHSGTQTAEWRQCPGRTCCHHRRGVASRHAVHHHQP